MDQLLDFLCAYPGVHCYDLLAAFTGITLLAVLILLHARLRHEKYICKQLTNYVPLTHLSYYLR